VLLALSGTGPIYHQVYEALRQAILDGRLTAGSRLPSTRTLSKELGVSRNTVLQAYDLLLAEGYAQGKHGSGTFVAHELPELSLAPRQRSGGETRKRRAATPTLGSFGERLPPAALERLRAWGYERPALLYDFRYGLPSFEDFPLDVWRRIVSRKSRMVTLRGLSYGNPCGLPALRSAIADYLQRARAVRCAPDQVIVVGGSQQGLDLTARLFLDPGSRVLMEEPHYQGARDVFLAAGAELVPVQVDEQGLDVDTVEALKERITLAYVTPSHQFPSGGILPLARRLQLLAWAEQHNVYIIEDDYDSEFRYDNRPVEAMQGLDTSGRVIYIGTFSKVLFPALRIGYLVVPPDLTDAFGAAKWLADRGCGTLEQETLAEFISEGHFERHLRRSRTRNAERRKALLDALHGAFGDAVSVTGADAGIHLVAWFDTLSAKDIAAVVRAAEAEKVGVYDVAPYYRTPPTRGGLMLGYSALTPEEIREGITRLAGVIHR